MNLELLLNNFSNAKIVVIGDVMLDKYIFGNVSRISPEAPVPILTVNEESYRLGGAANVAANISSLGGDVSLFGFVGKDENSKILSNLFREKGIKSFLDTNHKTTVKERIIGRDQQMIRLDREDNSPKYFTPEILAPLKKKSLASDVIIISDYAKGCVTSDLMRVLKSFNKKIIVDPKPQNTSLYSNCFLITPNEKEALEMSSQSEVYSAGKYLRDNLGCNVLITRGEKGMVLFSDTNIEIPTVAKEIYDVTGAGDTAIATLSLALSCGSSLEEAVILANHSAGISVGKIGTSTVSIEELRKEFFQEEKNKILDYTDLSEKLEQYHSQNKKICFTNGCFDILHPGHISYLNQAKKMGDVLIVGLNSDCSVKKIKGESRPINNQRDRATMLSALESVDVVTIFTEETPYELIRKIKPDVLVKGGDYAPEQIVGREFAKETRVIPFLKGYSTTKIISKLNGEKIC
jgi:D-beta-D-heptose 7-phosphate kinase / D-beta-D-heptose 1-phosphate adenosyltransferase